MISVRSVANNVMQFKHHVNPIPGGGGYGKFAYPSADLIFHIEEKIFTAPFFFTFNIF